MNTIQGLEVSVETKEPMTFRGVYHNIKYYEGAKGKIHCVFGWMPKQFDSVKSFQYAVRQWETADESA